MQDGTPTQPPVSRRLKIILGVSLALNLAVIGLIAGAILRHGDGGGMGHRSTGFSAYGLPYMMALPREDRRAVGQAMRAGGDLPDRRTRRALFRDVLEALRAQPFDAAALQQVVARQAETTIAVQKTAQTAWLDVVAAMSDAERRAYADEVERVLRRGPKLRK